MKPQQDTQKWGVPAAVWELKGLGGMGAMGLLLLLAVCTQD